MPASACYLRRDLPPKGSSVPLLTWFNRLAIAVAGILGAAGVVAAAGATHTGDQAILGPLALIALTQAPAVLALGLFAGSGRIVRNT